MARMPIISSHPLALLAATTLVSMWVWWFNHQRLLEPLGYLPPAEFEEHFHRAATTQATHVVEAALT